MHTDIEWSLEQCVWAAAHFLPWVWLTCICLPEDWYLTDGWQRTEYWLTDIAV